jgi:hypothetical protein
VPRSDIDRIREKIRLRQYDMSAHAMEEMAEDMLTILDVEEAVLTGQVIRVEKDDPRGTKFIDANERQLFESVGVPSNLSQ